MTISARDAAGNVGTTTLTVVYDPTRPSISITAPGSGAIVSGTTTVTATVTDNIAVAGVQFLLDGIALGAERTTPPFSTSWTTGTVANGSHALSARARDAAGNTAVAASVPVTVSNSAPASAPPPPSGLVAAYSFNQGTGTTVTDASGKNNTATLGSGVSWTTQGRFGSALAFNGTGFVTVPAAASLNLTTGMTLEAWVFPTAAGAGVWRNVIIKEDASREVYNLYSNTDTSAPSTWAVLTSAPDHAPWTLWSRPAPAQRLDPPGRDLRRRGDPPLRQRCPGGQSPARRLAQDVGRSPPDRWQQHLG